MRTNRATVSVAALTCAALAVPLSPAAVSAAGHGRPTPARVHVLGVGPTGHSMDRAAKQVAPAMSLPGGRRLAARSAAALHSCAFDDSLLCGKVTPLLDRSRASFGTTSVRFVVAPHTGAREVPKGVIFTSSGGPGNSITGSNGEMYPFRDYVLQPLTKRFDIVFVDQRGVGRSDALDCPGWQHDMSYALAGQCARSFGPQRNFYSTAAVADDIDDIRASLGYDQIFVMGGSYAGFDAATYGIRHPDHTVAVVAASAAPPLSADDPFDSATPEGIPDVVSALCLRSVECANAYPHPVELLGRLAARLRQHPVVGIGYDADGQPHHMRVTENALLWTILLDGDFPFDLGTVTQAAAALRAGDKVPLLRLAASHDSRSFDFDQGPVRDFSNAASLFRYCTDAEFPWDVSAPRGVRQQQYADALAGQPDTLGLFSTAAWAAPFPLGFFPDPCIAASWEHQPAYPPGTTVDTVPTLILTGDLDVGLTVAISRRLTEVLTDSTLIEVKGAAHNPWFWRFCAVEMVQQFIRTGVAEDLCAGQRIPRFWQPGSFPRSVARAPAATPGTGDESRLGDRRLATVTVWSLLDSIHQLWGSATATGRGLRGGQTSAEFSPGPPTPDFFHLHGVRFTRDVSVTGTGYFDWDNFVGGDFTVKGPGISHATLHFKGHWYTDDQHVIRVHGQIDGRHVSVTVPSF